MPASLILGTAGHIDHGKSSLIKALTGVDPDRLKEEKARGITIELGFAELVLPSGAHMGVVDVPGHEKFVRHMVAGATGIDVALLVIAADDGPMPQTREHLAILNLLGVKRAVVALTKADLVDPEWAQVVADDIEALLAPTPLAGAEIIPCSSVTKQGLPELLAAIDRAILTVETRASAEGFRLPVDRVFTIKGAGTVVTGTMWSGSVAVDDAAVAALAGIPMRVRSIQVHGESVERAYAGQRVAINLAGVDRDDIARGDTIASPGLLTPTTVVNAWLTYLGPEGGQPGAAVGEGAEPRPLKADTRVHVHHGTTEILGRILLPNGAALMPGDSAFVQLRLEAPIAPRYRDRFIIRSYSPVYTIGGGVILDVAPPRRVVLTPADRALLEALRDEDIDRAVLAILESRGLPMTSAQVALELGVERGAVASTLNEAKLERLKTGPGAKETSFIAPPAAAHLRAAIERELVAFHERSPKETDISARALRDLVDARLSADAFDALLAQVAEAGHAVVSAGKVRHPAAASSALAAEEDARASLLPLLESQGLSPELAWDLADRIGADRKVVGKVLARLVSEGELAHIGPDMFVHRNAMAAAESTIRSALTAAAGAPLGAAELRDALGISRKFAIPLLEFFDARGVTKREGEGRVLKG